eukprot:gnl/TRDRNA2_/TRDRNA2_164156_c2_seq6.p1 gnl/TRDRNA2_/TRDRNA2_164156_c2~~gnl/TRDRNA2_/TRDRNA2_164156_c2_seq6.p1  ORF type:complete len:537 (-),score=108.85 gnl/TRDRNA2_/TRDRNA2_164156_c2_seq6:215-1825(-)
MAAEMQQQDTDGARRNSHLPLNLPSIREGQSAHFETLIDPDMGDDCKKFNKQGTIGMESVSTAAPTGSQGLSSWDPSVASMTSPVASMEPGWLDEQDDFFVEEDDTSREALPRPPPGLEIVDGKPVLASKSPSKIQSDELPSRGSALHASGQCRPCAWFWKPQGCENGKECGHCHLCPKGELQSRKKEKITKMRASTESEQESPESQEVELPMPKTDGDTEGAHMLGPPGLLPVDLPSKGAELHGTGKCRPCAWFWKPQGCSNGKECGHCHACPEAELKNRKKEKQAILRSQNGNENEEDNGQDAEGNYYGDCMSPYNMEYMSMNPFSVPPILGSLPSYGSMLHGTGRCRPCAWFWKAQGCQNGQECGHCHICPDGEIKARKRVKVAVMRMTAGMIGPQPYGAQEDQQEAEEPDSEEVVGSSGEDSNASTQEPKSNEPLPEPLKLSETLTVSETLSLPSRGSVLHGTGNCRPCAWFWKPEKCLKDKECNYCHICSEDEIKARKKVKGKAMRMGAIQPLKRGTDSRVPRVLNINAVI